MVRSGSSQRIPGSVRHDVDQIFNFTHLFCAEHLEGEYADLLRKLVAKLARERNRRRR